jgi:hypothetical protein
MNSLHNLVVAGKVLHLVSLWFFIKLCNRTLICGCIIGYFRAPLFFPIVTQLALIIELHRILQRG